MSKEEKRGNGLPQVNDPAGNTHVLEAVEGWRVMELIREHGLPIEAMCGGACACATCHVHVAPDWAERLHAPRDDEEAMLDQLPAVEPTSRLSCQLIWDKHLDGLEVTPGGSLRRMKYFPLFADLDKAHVLVVGGGEQATQKVRLLLQDQRPYHGRRRDRHRRAARAGGDQRHLDRAARVPRPRPRGPAPRLCRHRRPRSSTPAVSRAAKARGIPVNVVDAPELSTFIMPAIVDRAPVTVAIGTEGAAPVLAREIKTRLGDLAARQSRRAGPARAGAARRRRQEPSPMPAPAAASGSACCRVPSAAPS